MTTTPTTRQPSAPVSPIDAKQQRSVGDRDDVLVNLSAVRHSMEAHGFAPLSMKDGNVNQVLPQHGQHTVIALDPGEEVAQVTVMPPTSPGDHHETVVLTTKSAHEEVDERGRVLPSQHSQVIEPDQESRTFDAIVRSWTYELIACSVAILMIVAEIVLLAHYDGKRTWRLADFGWKINSVFAFLTAVLEAAVAYIVTSCLGQLRWLWYYNGAGELRWLDRLTNARTAPGAFSFFLTTGPWRHLAGVGAWAGLGSALVLLLLGVGVFTQNVISQTDALVPMNATWTASVPVANNFSGSDSYQPGDKDNHELPSITMMSAIVTGFLSYIGYNYLDPIDSWVNCESGNCLFQNYSTLAVCTVCADVTDDIFIPCNSTQCPANETSVYFPGGSPSLNSLAGFINMTSDFEYPSEDVLADIGPLIAHFKGIGNAGSFPITPPYASECAIYWCVQTFNSTYDTSLSAPEASAYAVFTETPVSNWTNTSTSARTAYGQGTEIILQPSECYINGSILTANNNSAYQSACTFTVDPSSHRALQNYLVGDGDANSPGFLQGVGVQTNTSGPTQNPNHWNISTLAANVFASNNILDCLDNGTSPTSDCQTDLSWLFYETLTAMSDAMTSEIRTPPQFDFIWTYGTTQKPQQIYWVAWGWLAYPLVVVTIATMFLLATMIKSRHREPWKSSVVALILHGLDDESRREAHDLDNPNAMKEAQEKWTVTLDRRNGTYAFRKHGVRPENRRLDSMTQLGEVTAGGIVGLARSGMEAYGQGS